MTPKKVWSFDHYTNMFVIYSDYEKELFKTTELSANSAHALMKSIDELRSNSYDSGVRFVVGAVERLMENF